MTRSGPKRSTNMANAARGRGRRAGGDRSPSPTRAGARPARRARGAAPPTSRGTRRGRPRRACRDGRRSSAASASIWSAKAVSTTVAHASSTSLKEPSSTQAARVVDAEAPHRERADPDHLRVAPSSAATTSSAPGASRSTAGTHTKRSGCAATASSAARLSNAYGPDRLHHHGAVDPVAVEPGQQRLRRWSGLPTTFPRRSRPVGTGRGRRRRRACGRRPSARGPGTRVRVGETAQRRVRAGRRGGLREVEPDRRADGVDHELRTRAALPPPRTTIAPSSGGTNTNALFEMSWLGPNQFTLDVPGHARSPGNTAR